MRRLQLALLLFTLVSTSLAGSAFAQYMYLDSNADGVHTAADILGVNGTPTTVDVWLRTNVNRDGSPGVCPTADGPLTFNSYVVNIAASGGTASFTNFVNQRPEATVTLQPFNSSGTEMTVGMGSGTISPPGDYRLFTVTVTGTGGAPSLTIVPIGTLQVVDVTSFGSQCGGNDMDNTMKLGSEWFDADGLGANAVANHPPVVTAPATLFGLTGSLITVTGAASDPDAGENVTLSQTNNTPFYPASGSAGPSTNPSLTLAATPASGQAGNYQINWSAIDSHSGTGAATTALTVTTETGPPVITVPPTAAGTENSVVVITASATDADGGPLTLSETNNAPFFPPSFSVGPIVNPSLVLAGTPTFSQAGSYTVNWQAIESDPPNLSAQAATALTIANLNRNPVIAAPATAGLLIGVTGTITGSASDPDIQTVTLSQTNNTPFFPPSSSSGPSFNPSLTLAGMPSPGQAGNYTVTWSASDSNAPAGTATATTSVRVGPDPQPPVITAPATAAGTENSPVTITATASDFDANLVTLSQTNNAAFLPSGTSVGPVLNPSLSVTGTPNFVQSGSYTINWTAIDNGSASLSSSATTALTIANLNRNPVISAPATFNGPTGSAVTITGSATDPDAQNVTLSQTNNAAFLAGPSVAGPALNPSISLTGTPTLFQTGSYTINWSAVDANTPAGSSAATTAVTIGTPGRPPVITAPATFTIQRSLTFTITGSASDPDGSNVTLSQTNNAPFFPASSSSGPALNPTIALTGTSFVIGSFTINWSAVDAQGGTAAATTALTVYDANQPPAITAPAIVSGNENVPITVTAGAVDPDANLVTLSQTNNAPFFPASSSAGPALNPALTLTGTPNFTQAGSYSINWLATDNGTPSLSATASTALTIGGPHRNPVIFVAASVPGTEGMPISITASAAQPDGLDVTLCVGSLPGFLVGGGCTPPSPNPSLTISGTPGPNAAGSYTIQWTATDTFGGVAAAITALTIADSNRPPVLSQPAAMTVNEGATATQPLTATDADNDPLIYSKVGTSPLFMTVSASGLVTLAPGFADAGDYTATVRASDGSSYDQKSFAITVVNVNRCPTANAGGPYSGVLFAPVSFDGTGSSDPDGDALTYAWNFGDGSTGAGAMTSHTYVTRATYPVTLTIDDGVCAASATTTATIADGFTALAFTTGGNKTTSLGSGKPFTCVEVEPVAGSFDVANVNLASVKMVSMGTGSVSEIPADAGKTDIAGDKNGNGLAEIQACFAKEDLRLLFSALPAGRNEVDVTITGSLVTGGSFLASLTLTVKSTGGGLAANVSPNPLNPSAKVTFATTRVGWVRIALYDLNGRLVRTYLDESRAAGTHDVTIEGTSATGSPLASSVYFLKIETESDGTETKSLTILK